MKKFLVLIIVGVILIVSIKYLVDINNPKRFSLKKVDTIEIFELGKRKNVDSDNTNKVLKVLNSLKIKELPQKYALDGNIYSIKIVNKHPSKITAQTLIFFLDKIHWISYDKNDKIISDKWYFTEKNYTDTIKKIYSSLR